MASKPLIIATMLGASVGVPYLAARSGTNSNTAPAQSPPPAAAGNMIAPALTPAPPLFAGQPAAANPIAAPPSVAPSSSPGATVRPLPPIGTATAAPAGRSPSAEQALRFNVTKDWVYQSWDRKSTGPTDVGLYAIRVPLVSGTQASSLAGSLTYYFNMQNAVEHIAFRGRTGDPARLVRFLMQNYQMEPKAAPIGEQLYQVADSGGVQSELVVRPESIVSSGKPFGNYVVELELARPGSERYLPPRGTGLNIPQTPDSAAKAAEQASQASSAAASSGSSTEGGSYFNKVRYASPQEESELFRNRWPY